jgi:DNA polymerase delta subunit 1
MRGCGGRLPDIRHFSDELNCSPTRVQVLKFDSQVKLVSETSTMRISFKPMEWKKWEDDPEEPEQKFHIEAYGHNKESESVLVRIEDYNPYFYAELPDKQWSQGDIILIHEHLKKRLGNHAPLKCVLTRRKRLYYFRGAKTYPLLLLSFSTEEAMRHCFNTIKRPIEPQGMPKIQLISREFDVGSIKKLCAMRKISYICWIQAEAVELPIGHEDRISRDNGFVHEYIVSWRSLEPVPEVECSLWSISPLIMSWDIEVLSFQSKKFPNALNVQDECFMIGVTMQRLNQPSTRRHIVLVYGPHDNLPDAEVRRYDSELALIFGFCDLINEENPDVLLGYNIIGFDYKYVNRRLLNVLETWKPCGRIEGRRPELKEMKWNSSAYGDQEIIYLAMDGRISIDMLPIIKRDYKLDQFTLDFASFFFLKKNKAPVTPEDIFRYYKIAQGLSFPEIAEAAKGNSLFPFLKDYRLHTQEAISEVVDAYERCKGTESVVEAVLSVYRKYQSAVMAVIGHYCIIDTLRPIELLEHLNTWINVCELAQIVKVPIVDSFTRGQSIRVFSQLYDLIYAKGYYVDSRVSPNLPYTGGYVVNPVPGLYKDVVSFDFSSLYPSILIGFNVCYTTFVPEGVNIPDEMCNIIEWDEEGDQEAETFGEEGGGDVEVEIGEDGAVPIKKTKKQHFRFRFVKAEVHKGIFPEFLADLLAQRKATRKIMEDYEEYSPTWNVLNARQNALKVSCNSCYGFLGIRKGKIPLIEAALCITAIGRKSIHEVMAKILEKGGLQVYGDTDSAMFHLPGVPRDQLYAVGAKMAIDLSADLPPPMKLEFERAYASFFSVSAKRYAAVILQKNGLPETNEEKLYKRGIILSRRDNCIFLREMYKAVLLCIVYERGYEAAMDQVLHYTNMLMSGSVPLKKLIIIKSIAASYKSPSNVMAIFGARLKAMGKPVQSGDRLEFCFVESEQTLQGYKLALPEMIMVEPEKYKIDRAYYYEKAVMNPIGQLLTIAFHYDKHFIKKKLLSYIKKKQIMCRQIDEMGKKARTLKINFGNK